MIRAAALPPGLGAPASVTLAVIAIASASLAALTFGEAGGWLAHGPRPMQWNVVAWGALFLATWTLMTGVMMLPSSLPFLHAMHRVGGAAASGVAGAAFTLVWLAVGVLQGVALWMSGDVFAGLTPGSAERWAGASLVAAALYQASPFATACQRACAQPYAILARHWQSTTLRRRNAINAGLHYGATCVGCCVPMMVIMFVVGTHDLLWLLALATLMALQKHGRIGAHVALPLAATLAAAGVAIGMGWWEVPLHTLRALCGG